MAHYLINGSTTHTELDPAAIILIKKQSPDERADRFRKVAIAQRRGIRPALDSRIVHDLVNLISGDTRPDVGSSDVQNLASDLVDAR